MSEFRFDDIDRQQLIDAFIGETDEILDQIEQTLLRLEQTPENDELLHDIFRGVHTLKGNAACLQFDDLTQAAHVIEELLDGMREGRVEANVARISQLLEAVDVLRDVAVRSVNGNGALTETQNAIAARACAGGAIATRFVRAATVADVAFRAHASRRHREARPHARPRGRDRHRARQRAAARRGQPPTRNCSTPSASSTASASICRRRS